MAEDAARSRLGRGLAALIGDVDVEAQGGERRNQRRAPIEFLKPNPRNPRRDFSEAELEELTQSLRERGMIQPIVVRHVPGAVDSFEIIAGERRWRAAQMAGLDTVPAVIRKIPDEAAIAIALIENIQREDLNPIEEATALQRLIDEFRMTHQQIADSVGRSRAAVTNLLRLLSLNAEVRQMLDEGKMDMGHARALLALNGGSQSQAAQRVVEERLSVRETEDLVRKLLEKGAPAQRPTRASIDPDIRRLQDRLSEKLGARVQIVHNQKGKGRLIIEYNSNDELDGILARIR